MALWCILILGKIHFVSLFFHVTCTTTFRRLGFPDGSDGKQSACNAVTQEDHWSWEDPLEKGMAIHSSIQIGKEVCEGRILSPCFFNLYAEYIMQNVRLDESQTGIKTAGGISMTSDI